MNNELEMNKLSKLYLLFQHRLTSFFFISGLSYFARFKLLQIIYFLNTFKIWNHMTKWLFWGPTNSLYLERELEKNAELINDGRNVKFVYSPTPYSFIQNDNHNNHWISSLFTVTSPNKSYSISSIPSNLVLNFRFI